MPPRRRSVIREENFAHIVNDDGYYFQRMREILDILPRVKPPPHHVRLCDHVFMGSQRNAEDIDALRKDGIAYVLSCVQARRSTDSPYDRASGVRGFLLIPAEDREDFDIERFFESAIQFLECVRSEPGGQALVHCNLGVNRSGAVAAAYLMVAQRRNLLDVVQDLKTRRQSVLTNRGFRRQLIQFARKKGLLDPIVDTVTRITYCEPMDAATTAVVRKRRSDFTDDSARDTDQETERSLSIGASGVDANEVKSESVTLPRRKTRESRRLRNATALSDDAVSRAVNNEKEKTDKQDSIQAPPVGAMETVVEQNSIGAQRQLNVSNGDTKDDDKANNVGVKSIQQEISDSEIKNDKFQEPYADILQKISSIVEKRDKTKVKNHSHQNEQADSSLVIKNTPDSSEQANAHEPATGNKQTFIKYQKIHLGIDMPKPVAAAGSNTSVESKRAVSTLQNINLTTTPEYNRSRQSSESSSPQRLPSPGKGTVGKNEEREQTPGHLAENHRTTETVQRNMNKSKPTGSQGTEKSNKAIQRKISDDPAQSAARTDSNNSTETLVPTRTVRKEKPELVTTDPPLPKKSDTVKENSSVIPSTTMPNTPNLQSQPTNGPNLNETNAIAKPSIIRKIKVDHKLTDGSGSRSATTVNMMSLPEREKRRDTISNMNAKPTKDAKPQSLPKITIIPAKPIEIKLTIISSNMAPTNNKLKDKNMNTTSTMPAIPREFNQIQPSSASLNHTMQPQKTRNPADNKSNRIPTAYQTKYRDDGENITLPKTNEQILNRDSSLGANTNTWNAVPLTLSLYALSRNKDDKRTGETTAKLTNEASARISNHLSAGFNEKPRRLTRQLEPVPSVELTDDEDIASVANEFINERRREVETSDRLTAVQDQVTRRYSAFERSAVSSGRHSALGWVNSLQPYAVDGIKYVDDRDDDDRCSVVSCFEPYGGQKNPSRNRSIAIEQIGTSAKGRVGSQAGHPQNNERFHTIGEQTSDGPNNGVTWYNQSTNQRLRNVDSKPAYSDRSNAADDVMSRYGEEELYYSRNQDANRRLSSAEYFRPVNSTVNSADLHSGTGRRLSSIENSRFIIPNQNREIDLRQNMWTLPDDISPYPDFLRQQSFNDGSSGDRGRLGKLISDIKHSAVNLAMRGTAVMNMAVLSAIGSASPGAGQDNSIRNSAMKFSAINSAVRSAVSSAMKGSAPNRFNKPSSPSAVESLGARGSDANQAMNFYLYSNRGLASQINSARRNQSFKGDADDGTHPPVVINIPVKHDGATITTFKSDSPMQPRPQPERVLDKAVLGDIKEQLRKVPRASNIPQSKTPTAGFQFPALRNVSKLKKQNDEKNTMQELQHFSSGTPRVGGEDFVSKLQDSNRRFDDVMKNHIRQADRSDVTTQAVPAFKAYNQAVVNVPVNSNYNSGLRSHTSAKRPEVLPLAANTERADPNTDTTSHWEGSVIKQANSSNSGQRQAAQSPNDPQTSYATKSPTRLKAVDDAPSETLSYQDNGFATIPRLSQRNRSARAIPQQVLQELDTAVKRHSFRSSISQVDNTEQPRSNTSEFVKLGHEGQLSNTETLQTGERISNKSFRHSGIDNKYNDQLQNSFEMKQKSFDTPNYTRTWPRPSSSSVASSPKRETSKPINELSLNFEDETPRNTASYPSSPRISAKLSKPPLHSPTDRARSSAQTPARDPWSVGNNNIIGISEINIQPTSKVSFRYRTPDGGRSAASTPPGNDDSNSFSGFLMHVGTRRAGPAISQSSSQRNLARQWKAGQSEDIPGLAAEAPAIMATEVDEPGPCDRPIRAYTRSRTDSEIIRHRPRT